jgi:hypothetical protein
MNWSEIFTIVPPTNVALLIVICLLFRALDKKDRVIDKLGTIVHRNSEVTNSQATMIQTLLQRGKL